MKGFVTFRRTVLLLATLAYAPPTFAQIDPLPSWNDGASKQPIVSFVKATTTPGSPTFVAISERIATFDQDGTLWVSHPMCAQVVFCLDRVPALVKAKPELAMKEPFKTVMSGNRDAIATLSNADLEKILMATLTGMSVDDFTADAKKWIADAGDPRWKKPYTELSTVRRRALPDTKVGAFPQALYDEAVKQGWVVISIKGDWKRVFAFDP